MNLHHFFLRKSGLSFLFLILIFPFLHSQNDCTLRIEGHLMDEHDRDGLAYGILFLEGTTYGAVSDSNGYFVIEKICKGKYTLVCIHIGCDTMKKVIDVKNNQTLELYLEHHKEELWKVELIGIAGPEKYTQPSSEIKGIEMLKTKGLSLGDALKFIPGVNSLNTGSTISKPMIHGLHSNRILILNQGLRLEGQQWGSEHAPEIDALSVNQIKIIKGAGTVRYGPDAIGGVILTEPGEEREQPGLNQEYFMGGASNGGMGYISAKIEEKLKRIPSLIWRVQATGKISGNLRMPGYFLDNTGTKENHYHVAIKWKKFAYGGELLYSDFNSKLGIYSGSHVGSLTDLETAIHSPKPLADSAKFTYSLANPFQKIHHRLVKFQSYLRAGTFGKLNFIYGFQANQRQEFDLHSNPDSAGKSIPALQLDIQTHTAELTMNHNRIRNVEGIWGLNYIYQNNAYEGRFFIPFYRAFNGGGFLVEKLKKEKFEIEAGLRYDYKRLEIFIWENDTLKKPVHYFSGLSGTLGGTFHPSSLWSFQLNTGLAWRAPGVNEMYAQGLHHGASAVENGDRDLKKEQAWNSTASIKISPNGKFDVEIGGYTLLFVNYVYLSPKLPPTLTIRGAFPTFEYKQADAVFFGTDVQCRWDFIEELGISFKGSAVRAKNISNGGYFYLIPPDRGELALRIRKSEWSKFSGIEFSPSLQLVLEQKRINAGEDYASPPPGYFLINAGLTFSLPVNEIPITWNLSVSNLLNKNYRDYLDRFRYFHSATGTNFMLRIHIPIFIP